MHHNTPHQVLNLISYDELAQRTVASVAGPLGAIYQTLDRTTEQLEQDGVFWVEDQKIDTHTLVRKFATADQGHVASLIVVGGQANELYQS